MCAKMMSISPVAQVKNQILKKAMQLNVYHVKMDSSSLKHSELNIVSSVLKVLSAGRRVKLWNASLEVIVTYKSSCTANLVKMDIINYKVVSFGARHVRLVIPVLSLIRGQFLVKKAHILNSLGNRFAETLVLDAILIQTKQRWLAAKLELSYQGILAQIAVQENGRATERPSATPALKVLIRMPRLAVLLVQRVRLALLVLQRNAQLAPFLRGI